jgi:hypothetical protein
MLTSNDTYPLPPPDDMEEVAVEDVSDMELRALTYPALDAGL